jgi:sulfur carrier protein ThiS
MGMILVNNEVIKRCSWDNYTIPENSEITIVNQLRDG